MTKMVLVGIDWGTSSARAYAFDARGKILATASDHPDRPMGVQTLKLRLGHEPSADDFGAALTALLQALQAKLPSGASTTPPGIPISGVPIIASGMIGSKQGLKDAGYALCPAMPATLAGLLVKAECGGHTICIVPGLRMPCGAGLLPDFMRGEETQVLGALEPNAPKSNAAGSDTLVDFTKIAINPHTDRSNPGLFVLPGSHSKWLDVVDSTITKFETHFSGELFAVLREHSILGRLFEPGKAQDVSPDLVAARTKAFELGVQTARDHPNKLLQHLFTTRALGLDGQLHPGAGESFLSGLLIGHEITSALASRPPISKINLIGSRELCERYAWALNLFHVSGETLSDTAALGLWRLAQAAHLI